MLKEDLSGNILSPARAEKQEPQQDPGLGTQNNPCLSDLMHFVPLFGQWIKEARTRKGVSQEWLAKASGISTVYISKIERDTSVIPSDNICRIIAKNLDLDEEEAIRISRGNKVKLGKMAIYFPQYDLEKIKESLNDKDILRLVEIVITLKDSLKDIVEEEEMNRIMKKFIDSIEAQVKYTKEIKSALRESKTS